MRAVIKFASLVSAFADLTLSLREESMIASVSRRDSNSSLDIATLAMRYGVSLRTLRFYESQGLLTPTRQNGKRLYSGRDCVRLEIIIKGKKLGLSLREIGALIHMPRPTMNVMRAL